MPRISWLHLNATLSTRLFYDAFVSENSTSGDRTLLKFFNWVQVNQTAFRLDWDKQELTQHHVDQITVTATPFSKFGHAKFVSAGVAAGQINLTKLLPDTQYEFITQVYKKEHPLLKFSVNVKTVPTGKFKLSHIHRISLHAFRARWVELLEVGEGIELWVKELHSLHWNHSVSHHDQCVRLRLRSQSSSHWHLEMH